MNKRISWLLMLAFAVPFLGAARCNPGDVKVVELAIFHTNDMHSHMRAPKTDPFGLGGMARLSTLIKRLRQSSPVSVLVDGGDFSEGSFYFSADSGANMVRLMGMMGYDAAALGNHDFLVGPDQLIRTLKDGGLPFPVLAANFDAADYEREDELLEAVPATYVKEVGGLKVGFIGLTTFGLVYDSYMKPVRILNQIDVATKVAKQLRPGVDVLVILSHNDFDSNLQLAKSVPGVDAVISGHSHEKMPKATLVDNAGRRVPVVETGQWGTFLGELRLQVAPDHGVVQYKSYELHPVSADLAEDPAIAAEIDRQDQLLSARYGRDVHAPIARAEVELDRSDYNERPFGNLAVKAYRAATGADVALEEAALTGVDVPKGPASFMDLHDVVPHIYDHSTGKEWMLRVWTAKGSDLLLAMNVFYTIEGLVPMGSPLGWLLTDGAQLTWDPGVPRTPIERATSRTVALPAIKSVIVGGKPLDPGARYKVALSDGLLRAISLANDKFHVGLDLSDMKDSGIEAWQAVVSYATGAIGGGGDGDKLSVANLMVGKAARTEAPDLGILAYGMDWDGSKLTVEVQNTGLKGAPSGTLHCATGLRDDIIAYGTAEQKWTSLPVATIPAIAAGGTAKVEVRWARSRLQAGLWPVTCEARLQADEHVSNNDATKVFRAL